MIWSTNQYYRFNHTNTDIRSHWSKWPTWLDLPILTPETMFLNTQSLGSLGKFLIIGNFLVINDTRDFSSILETISRLSLIIVEDQRESFDIWYMTIWELEAEECQKNLVFSKQQAIYSKLHFTRNYQSCCFLHHRPPPPPPRIFTYLDIFETWYSTSNQWQNPTISSAASRSWFKQPIQYERHCWCIIGIEEAQAHHEFLTIYSEASEWGSPISRCYWKCNELFSNYRTAATATTRSDVAQISR